MLSDFFGTAENQNNNQKSPTSYHNDTDEESVDDINTQQSKIFLFL